MTKWLSAGAFSADCDRQQGGGLHLAFEYLNMTTVEATAVDDVARRYGTNTEAWDLVIDAPDAGVRPITTSYPDKRSTLLSRLLLLNLLLQIFDGIATYSGLHLGIREANPLLRGAFQVWGVALTLLVFKGSACALLFFIYRFAAEQLATLALSIVASVYSVCSLIPWLLTLFALLSCFT